MHIYIYIYIYIIAAEKHGSFTSRQYEDGGQDFIVSTTVHHRWDQFLVGMKFNVPSRPVLVPT
jgi:hypothetical protein